ncbi:MAG: DegT/DnrJ/EryC1/StrS family aminotransferase [Thermodesulfobacteriota bacterium]
MPERIFLSAPHMSGAEQRHVAEAFASNFIAPLGPQLAAFERRFEELLGGGHCVAVSSGTAALHLALRLAGVGPGDEVLCSDLTFIGSVTPILFQGATPVFVDSEPGSWNLDPALAAQCIADRARAGRPPKALILVHLYGQAADFDPVAEACAEHGVELVEDAAESLGATYKGRPTGSLARMGIFSFNGNKIITTGGGGMFASRDKDLADRARFLSTQAREPEVHYEHVTWGYNYRLSNVAAAIGLGQLEALPERVLRRREIFAAYQERLGDLEEICFMPEAAHGVSNRWLTCVTLGRDREQGFALREKLRLGLEAENIESRPVWKPMHLQPVFKDAAFAGSRDRAVSADLFWRGLCLPSGTGMSEADLDRVCATIRRILRG